MIIKLTHDIILGAYQLANSSHYTHDVNEQDSACPLAQQYPFAQKQWVISGHNRLYTILFCTKQDC